MSQEEVMKLVRARLVEEFPFLGKTMAPGLVQSIVAWKAGHDPFKNFEIVPAPGFTGRCLNLGPMLVKYKGDHTIVGSTVHVLKEIEDMQFQPEDVLIAGAWKTGTTWISEIAYMLMNSGDKPDDPLRERTTLRVPALDKFWTLGVAQTLPSPRIIKCHFHYYAMPPSIFKAKPKILYIYRHPKDSCVSLYHFTRMFMPISYTGSFSEFFELFMKGTVPSGHYLTHIKSFWEKRNDINILFVAYEDLQKDFRKEVSRIAAFLGKNLTPEELVKLQTALSFKTMAANPSTNYSWWDEDGLRNKGEAIFMRKGVVGDWKNYMTDEQSRRMEEMAEKEMADTEIQFCYSM